MTSPLRPARAWFIAGTDTEIGKTFSTCALLHAARAQGQRAVGMKPIAAGAEIVDGVRLNEDVVALRAASSFDAGLAMINPYCLLSPIAPHIAAAEEGVCIEPTRILAAADALRQQADVVLVEGVGGWRVPLGDDYDAADLAADLGLPVILVVGMRLGCISHALLTVESIARRGLPLAGWIANHIDPAMLRQAQNIDALRARIDAPLLGILPWQAQRRPDQVAAALRLPD